MVADAHHAVVTMGTPSGCLGSRACAAEEVVDRTGGRATVVGPSRAGAGWRDPRTAHSLASPGGCQKAAGARLGTRGEWEWKHSPATCWCEIPTLSNLRGGTRWHGMLRTNWTPPNAVAPPSSVRAAQPCQRHLALIQHGTRPSIQGGRHEANDDDDDGWNLGRIELAMAWKLQVK